MRREGEGEGRRESERGNKKRERLEGEEASKKTMGECAHPFSHPLSLSR